MKKSLLLSCFVLGAVAHASFDVTMLPGADGRVYRYDPENNVILGSYNSGAGLKSVTLVPGTSDMLVHRNGDAALVNVWTGQRRAFAPVSNFVADFQWNTLRGRFEMHFLASTSYVDDLSYPNLETVLGPIISNVPTSKVLALTSGRYLGLTAGTTTISVQSAPTYGVQMTNNVFTWTSNGLVSNMLEIGNNFAMFAYNTPGGIGLAGINAFGTNSVGATGNFTTESISGFDVNAPLYLNKSHNGIYMYGKDSLSSNWRVLELGTTTAAGFFTVMPSVIVPIGYTQARPSTFLAPEPASMTALGLGVLAALRRRKTR